MSAHRTPAEVAEFVSSARDEGYSAFICGAGMAAHLAGRGRRADHPPGGRCAAVGRRAQRRRRALLDRADAQGHPGGDGGDRRVAQRGAPRRPDAGDRRRTWWRSSPTTAARWPADRTRLGRLGRPACAGADARRCRSPTAATASPAWRWLGRTASAAGRAGRARGSAGSGFDPAGPSRAALASAGALPSASIGPRRLVGQSAAGARPSTRCSAAGGLEAEASGVRRSAGLAGRGRRRGSARR